MTVQGFTAPNDAAAQSSLNEVGPDYFRTVGIPLVAGREFTAADRAGAPKVAIVNEAFVRHFIGNRNPIGVGVYRGGGKDVKFDTFIVGVVKDAKYSNMKEPVPPDRRRSGRRSHRRLVLGPADPVSAVRDPAGGPLGVHVRGSRAYRDRGRGGVRPRPPRDQRRPHDRAARRVAAPAGIT